MTWRAAQAVGMLYGTVPVNIVAWAETREKAMVTLKVHLKYVGAQAERWLEENSGESE